MARVTVVRSLVGEPLVIEGVKDPVRPWCYAELTNLTPEQRKQLRELEEAKKINVAVVIDGVIARPANLA